MTKRQQIVEAMATALRGITGMATKVHIWKDPASLTPSDMPCIIVKDGRADVGRQDLDGGYQHRLLIEAAWWSTGVSAWQDAQTGIDTMLAAFQADPTLGGLVLLDELTGHDIYTSQAGSIEAAGLLEFSLTYITDAGTL